MASSIKKALSLSESLFTAWDDALLFRTLAALRLDVPVFDTAEGLCWKGAHPNFEEYCQRMKSPESRLLDDFVWGDAALRRKDIMLWLAFREVRCPKDQGAHCRLSGIKQLTACLEAAPVLRRKAQHHVVPHFHYL